MSQCFKPVRRKIGVLMLVLACMFAVGWVSSIGYYEDVHFYGGNTSVSFAIMEGDVYFSVVTIGETFENVPTDTGVGWLRASSSGWLDFFDRYKWRWQFLRVSIGVRDILAPRFSDQISVIVPCWLILAACISLCAWLMLSKPRAKKTLEKQG